MLAAIVFLAQQAAGLESTVSVSWVNVLLNTSALGILGYHLLFGLPKMINDANDRYDRLLKLVTENSRDDRAAFEQRNQRYVDSIDNLAQSIGGICRYNSHPPGPSSRT